MIKRKILPPIAWRIVYRVGILQYVECKATQQQHYKQKMENSARYNNWEK